jgi:uncharacterized membrane protein YozB (DUF420 family)
MILIVIFVVLMMFWLFAGVSARSTPPPSWAPLASDIIPWLCVAILGWVLFSGSPPPAIR